MPHKDRNKRIEYAKQYYKNNREELRKKNKEYCTKNKEEIKERVKLYYQNNKEKYSAYKIEYQLKNKEKIREYQLKYTKSLNNINKHSDISKSFLTKKVCSMKNRHDSVTLTAEELLELIPKDLKCPVFGIKFVFGKGNNWSDKQNSMSIDRIDNNKGYHKDNVVVVSFKANTMKSTATLKELYQVADFYHKLEKKLNA